MNEEETIDEMVRDFTSVVPKSKSEVRSRILVLLNERERELIKKIKGLDYSEKYIDTNKWYGMDGDDAYEMAKGDILEFFKGNNK